MALRTLSLCSGYGGLELALRDVFGKQVRTVCYVEWEVYAATTLMARMEEQRLDKAPIWDDITTFDGKAWSGKVDIITCGFPCQPVSVAGKRASQEDERWIWPDIIRIICEIRPRFIYLENVAGLLSGGLDLVLGDLAKAGYDAEWTSIKANEIGAAHNRLRVFILANSGSRRLDWRTRRNGKGIELSVQTTGSCSELADTDNTGNTTQRFGSKQTGKKDDKRWSESSFVESSRPNCELADTRCEFTQGKDARGQSTIKIPRTNSGKMDESEQGFISTWFPPGPDETELWEWLLVQRPEIKPSFCRIHDGPFDKLVKPFRTERLTMLGNGVVPQQGSAAFQILWERFFK